MTGPMRDETSRARWGSTMGSLRKARLPRKEKTRPIPGVPIQSRSSPNPVPVTGWCRPRNGTRHQNGFITAKGTITSIRSVGTSFQTR